MLKALFRKQMSEIGAFMFTNVKTGKRRSSAGIAGYAVLMVFLAITLMFTFGMIAFTIVPLCEVGLTWYYFGIMTLVAIAFGVLGSVFTTYSGLYLAKDNELLLSMPVKPMYILFVRMSGVYIMGLIYSAVVMIPALFAYFTEAPQTVLTVIFSVMLIFIVSFIVLVLSCVLGWVVAQIASRLKNKSMITVIISLSFIAAYYYFYSKAINLLSSLVENGAQSAEAFRKWGYVFTVLGKAAEGNVIAFALALNGSLALVLLCLYVLSLGFTKLATMNPGSAKKKKLKISDKSGSIGKALLGKEIKRFTSSANYMLNCGLGIVFSLVIAVAALIKTNTVRTVAFSLFSGGYEDLFALIICAASCMMAATVDITAPSVSLEGKNIWIAQSLPIDFYEILKAKLSVHLIFGLIPTVLCTVALLFVFMVDIASSLVTIASVILFTVLCAEFGLFINLKLPNLNWTNEVAPIKQSAAVGIALFGGWGVVVVLGVLYYLISSYVSAFFYLCAVSAVFAVLTVILNIWLRNKGSRIFASL